ncbi:MAG: hypothetical protein NVSMB42_12910 [Herpetosiphon sp.]
MQQGPPSEPTIADIVDGTVDAATADRWLSQHPEQASEVLVARRVANLMLEVRLASLDVPADFEARLIARLHDDRTLVDLLDLGLGGTVRTLLELLDLLFGLLRPQAPASA